MGAVTDNGANMIAALNLSLPGLESSSDANEEDQFLAALMEAENTTLEGLFLFVDHHAVENWFLFIYKYFALFICKYVFHFLSEDAQESAGTED